MAMAATLMPNPLAAAPVKSAVELVALGEEEEVPLVAWAVPVLLELPVAAAAATLAPEVELATASSVDGAAALAAESSVVSPEWQMPEVRVSAGIW
jgi:hypothetical protein